MEKRSEQQKQTYIHNLERMNAFEIMIHLRVIFTSKTEDVEALSIIHDVLERRMK